MELTAANVQQVLVDCLFKDEEIENGAPLSGIEYVKVSGVMRQFGFHKERLMSHQEDIMSMLLQLEREFLESGGGGMSFLRMCMTKDGVHWAEHSRCDELICLGLGIGKVQILLRDLANTLPGGVPYILVKDM
jgi:hypothetical protein